ncbi:MAG: YdeI/OmpD-associated family protein [Ardenticatenaceae bacterium]|nr:YdeI/OmpD-associated family protein [Ardenticatenaceae bacterium]
MFFYQHSFVAHIQEHSLGFNKNGELIYTVLFLPDDVIDDLPLDKNPRLRLEGEMHEHPFEGAVQPAKGRWYLLISRTFMKKHNLDLGDSVEVRFNIADQNYVEVPAELKRALDENDEALRVWATLSAGKKRGYAAHVSAAKKSPTRERRALKMIEYILEGKNAGGRSF